MSITNGFITKPIDITDIGNALQTSSTDDGTLCTHQNINKWSKHKPVACDKKFPKREDYDHDDMHWRTLNSGAFYGLRISGITGNPVDAKQLYGASNPNYEYIRPSSPYPYRMGDFDGYFHNADKMCYLAYANDFQQNIVVSTSTDSTSATFTLYGAMNTGGVTFKELEEFLGAPLVLCAHVYCNDTYIKSYINNSYVLNAGDSPETLETKYDDDGGFRYKQVTINFAKTLYWGVNKKDLVVYFTLDRVGKVQTPAGYQWNTIRRVPIFYDDSHGYRIKVRIDIATRSFQPCRAFHTKEQQWLDYYKTFGKDDWSPYRFSFKISKDANEALALSLSQGGTTLRAKYRGTTVNGKPIAYVDANGTIQQTTNSSYTVAKGDYSQTVEVMFEFLGIYAMEVYPVDSRGYFCDIYIVKNLNTANETEEYLMPISAVYVANS